MTPRPPAFDQVRRLVEATRRRLRARASLVALGWCATSLGLLALAAVLLGATSLGGGWLRGLALAAMAGAAGFSLVRYGWLPFRRYGPELEVALHIERGVPELCDGLIATVQLGDEWDKGTLGAPELVAELAHRVAVRLGLESLARCTPWTPARRPWGFAGGVGLVWILFVVVTPGTVSRGLATLFPPPHATDTRYTGPLVGDLTLTLHYPDHTGRSPRTISSSSGDFEAPKGTRVEIQATTLEPARSVAIRFGDGDGDGAERPLVLSDQRDARGELVVTEAGRWRFVIVTAAGDTLIEAIDRRIRIEPDRPPRVTLLLPEADLELEDLRAVPVAWEATDDFGLTRGAIVLALATDPEHPERVEQPHVEGTRARGNDEVDLSVVQAQPGDRIALSVEIYDNNTVDGPQTGVSVTRYITVHSPDAKHAELSERLRQTVDALLDALADRLEVDLHAPGPPLWPDRLTKLTEATGAAAKTLAEVVAALAEDPLTAEEVRLALAGRLGALEKAVGEERTLTRRLDDHLGAPSDAEIRQISRQNESVVTELEQTIVMVEAMVARLALEDLLAMTEEIRAAKENLRELIEAYRQNPDEALKARIMREIQRLRARIRTMRERMARLRQKLPEEFLNIEGLKKDEVSKGLKNAEDQLSDIEKMLDEGKIDEALAAMEEMSNALDEMTQALNQDLQDLHASTNPAMQRAINELLDQTRDLMKRQQRAGEKTQAQADAESEALQEALQEELKEKLDAIRKRARRLRDLGQEVDPAALPRFAEEELSNLRQRVDDLNGALERPDLRESLEMARRALDHLDTLERSSRMYGPRQDARSRGPLLQGQGVDRLIIEDLEKLLESAQQRAEGATDPQQLEELAQKQGELSEAARRLRQRIEQNRQEVPGMSPEMAQRADRASEAMQESSERLHARRPGQARPGQKQAVSELRGLMEGLKQSLKPKQAKRDRDSSGRRNANHRKVRIPGADDYEAPAEFRKDLLEAMKDKPPESYREQVKRYYESLVH